MNPRQTGRTTRTIRCSINEEPYILLGEGIVHWTMLAKHATHLRSKRQEPSAGTSHSFIQHAGNQIRQVIILRKEQK
jgi:hypothetical protein